jgi:pimeloyl-ACP methyl ester carboxylesterase
MIVVCSRNLAAQSVDDYPVPGVLVNIGDRSLHLNCKGEGKPSVILDSGLGGNSLDWSRVQPTISGHTQVCAYDRAGYGWSEPGPLPRTSDRIADELHILLKTAGIEGPYVLVGHSFGGYNVRMFASHYPDETAGLILVDAAHEDQFRRFKKDGIIQSTAGSRYSAISGPRVPANLPEDIQQVARSLVTTAGAFMALQGEMQSFSDSAEIVKASRPLPDVPYVVITRGQRVYPPTPKGDQMAAIWRELQDDLAIRTSYHQSDAGVSHLVAKNAGHYVHLDEPDIVIDAIRNVVEKARHQFIPKHLTTTLGQF